MKANRVFLSGAVLCLGAFAHFLPGQTANEAIRDERLGDFELLQTVELKAPTHHVQGLVVEGESIWVTSVQRETRKGRLHRFEGSEWVASREIQEGDRYHPGGMQGDATSLWIPVAQYRRGGVTTIQRRDKRTLELLSRFEVDDHIGCLALDGDRLIGGNWDTRTFYFWNLNGRLIEKRENTTANHYQDMKVVAGRLVASGKIRGVRGAVDWLDLDTLLLQRRILGGATDRGVSFMNEGMDLHNGRLYLMPEDDPSRVFVFNFE